MMKDLFDPAVTRTLSVNLPNAKTATEEEMVAFIVEFRGTNFSRATEIVGQRPEPRETLDCYCSYLHHMRNIRFRENEPGFGTLKWPRRFAWAAYRYLPPDLQEAAGGTPEFQDDPYPV